MNRDKVIRKVESIEGYLQSLAPIVSRGLDAYLGDEISRLAGERILQLIVDAASDINSELLFDAGRRVADRYYDQFMELPEISLVKVSMAKQLASFSGLRNRLVHDYEEINHEIVYDNLNRALRLFPLYLEAVLNRVAPSAPESQSNPELGV